MATVTLRPISDNSVTHTPVGAASNWDCVNEASSDDDTTYVRGTSLTTDLYNIEANSIGASDTINSVTIYAVAKLIAGRAASRNIYMKIGGTTVGSTTPLTTTYATYSGTTTTNPATGLAFTKAEIDSLVFGFTTDSALLGTSYTTQVYAIIDYTPSGGGGGSPTVKPIMMMLETDD